MVLTKGKLIELLTNNPLPLDTPISALLQCTNNDESIASTSITGIETGKDYYNSQTTIRILGTYEEDEF